MYFIFNILLIFTSKLSKPDGLDERFPLEDPNDKIYQISNNINKNNLLDKLNSNSVNINEKLNLIQKYNVLNYTVGTNILKGGLLNDWEFDIFIN
jgi:hypothetical protein